MISTIFMITIAIFVALLLITLCKKDSVHYPLSNTTNSDTNHINLPLSPEPCEVPHPFAQNVTLDDVMYERSL